LGLSIPKSSLTKLPMDMSGWEQVLEHKNSLYWVEIKLYPYIKWKVILLFWSLLWQCSWISQLLVEINILTYWFNVDKKWKRLFGLKDCIYSTFKFCFKIEPIVNVKSSIAKWQFLARCCFLSTLSWSGNDESSTLSSESNIKKQYRGLV
jgi:hypothetical protein